MRRMMTTGAIAATFTVGWAAQATAQDAPADDPYAELLKQGGTVLPGEAAADTSATDAEAATSTAAITNPETSGTNPFGSLGLFALGALLICGAGVAAARVQKQRGMGLDADMYHVKSMKLGARHQISVVVVHGRSYVLGVAEGSINVLDRLDDDKPQAAPAQAPVAAAAPVRPVTVAPVEDLAVVWEQMFERVTEQKQQAKPVRMKPEEVPSAYDGLFSEFSEHPEDFSEGRNREDFSEGRDQVETLPEAPGARPSAGRRKKKRRTRTQRAPEAAQVKQPVREPRRRGDESIESDSVLIALQAFKTRGEI